MRTSCARDDSSQMNGARLADDPSFLSVIGSLYLVYGADGPGGIRIVQLNESDGRLPKAAQPGFANDSASSTTDLYHLVALGPSFTLEQDELALPHEADAYVAGRVQPREPEASYVQAAFVLPHEHNGRAHYLLFVSWFDDGLPHHQSASSLARVYVGRADAPTGPFYDRDGNDMAKRREVTLGHERIIRVLSARWGANCDGVGYEVGAVARLYCESKPRCSWALDSRALDAIDPLSYLAQVQSTRTTVAIRLQIRREPGLLPP